MGYYGDLREFLSELDRRGKLWRIPEPVNKDAELMPFYRLQQRGLPPQDRRVILFERPVSAQGRPYDMSVVAGVYGASREIHLLGLQCGSVDELQERWHEAIAHPLDPVTVQTGPVQEVVHTGAELEQLGLEGLPVPVEEPGFSCMIRTGTPMVTRDPITGARNAGCYNGFFRSRTRIAAGIAPMRESFVHWLKARQRGERAPVAIVLGATPNFVAVGSAPIPAGMDEYAVAGALVGDPMQLVPCKTIPLEVPANAEVIVEGWFDDNLLEPRVPFGEYPGYLNPDWNQIPLIHVSAITHRRDAIFTPILVGFPPSETNVLWGEGQAGVLYHRLRYEAGLPVRQVHHLEIAGGNDICVLQMEDVGHDRGWEVLEAAAQIRGSKWLIVVDHDVDPSDPELVLWSITYRIHRVEEEVRMVAGGGGGGLDPSAAPPRSGRGELSRLSGQAPFQKVLVNAMRPWPYPPVALPAREYMERALQIWRSRSDAPALNLRTPWFGYTLGHWTEEEALLASLIAQGKFIEAGDFLVEHQTAMTDEMAERTLARGARVV